MPPNDVEEMALKKDIPDGTMDYGDLENKPSIGGIELEGNKTLEQLGIQPKGNYLTKVPDEYVTDNEMKTELAKKLDKNQGTENAGSYRYIMRFCCMYMIRQMKGKCKENRSTN